MVDVVRDVRVEIARRIIRQPAEVHDRRECGTLDCIVWQPRPLLTLFDDARRTDIRLAPLPAPFALLPTMLAMRHPPLRAKLSNTAPTRAALHLTEADVLSLDIL